MTDFDYVCGSFDRTGGLTYRDLAASRCAHYDALQICPIDAPSYISAGSCNSTEYTNWNGDFLVGQTSIERD